MTIQINRYFIFLILSFFVTVVILFFIPNQIYASNSPATFDWVKSVDEGKALFSIGSDSSGNIYLSGDFSGSNVNFNPDGSDLKSSNGAYDVFLTKYNTDGTYAWTKTWGGSALEYALSLTLDSNDNVYVTGEFYGSNVNFNPDGSDLKSSNGGADVFLTKYNTDGTYAWTKTWGGTSSDVGNSIASDSSDNIYVVGYFAGSNVNFNPAGSDLKNSNGSNDIFITKYSADGTYNWTDTSGGALSDNAYSIAIDSNDNVYVAGDFMGSNTNLSPTGMDLYNSYGSSDIFLSKYGTGGNYVWTETSGGTDSETAYSIATDSDNNIYIVGDFVGTDVNFNPNGTDLKSSNGTYDIFLTKYSSDGSYAWTNTWGGTGYEDNLLDGTLYIDSRNNIYVTGFFEGTVDFDPGENVALHASVGSGDAFLSSFGSSGQFQWVKTFGSTGGWDEGHSIGGYGDNIYFGGLIYGPTDFNPGGTPSIHTPAISSANFLVRYRLPSLLPSVGSAGLRQFQINQFDNPEVGGVYEPVENSDTRGRDIDVIIEPYTLSYNAYLSVNKRESSSLVNSKLNLFGLKRTKSNTIFAGPFIAVKVNNRFYWQVGDLEEIWYKAYAPVEGNHSDAIIIPSIQKKPSIISLSYKDSELVPPGDPTHPFDPGSLRLAYSEDGITWSILNSSVVDEVNHTVSVVQKLGGYYTIVSSPYKQ